MSAKDAASVDVSDNRADSPRVPSQLLNQLVYLYTPASHFIRQFSVISNYNVSVPPTCATSTTNIEVLIRCMVKSLGRIDADIFFRLPMSGVELSQSGGLQ